MSVMSVTFSTDKDGIIDYLCDDFGVVLEDEEYEHLRELTRAQLYLVSIVVGRAVKRVKVEQEMVAAESLSEASMFGKEG